MSITQLDPPIYLLTPLGSAVCHFVWSNGPDSFMFGCFQDETGESWWWPNHQVRLQTNISDGRFTTSPIHERAPLTAALAPHRQRYAPEKKKRTR